MSAYTLVSAKPENTYSKKLQIFILGNFKNLQLKTIACFLSIAKLCGKDKTANWRTFYKLCNISKKLSSVKWPGRGMLILVVGSRWRGGNLMDHFTL